MVNDISFNISPLDHNIQTTHNQQSSPHLEDQNKKTKDILTKSFERQISEISSDNKKLQVNLSLSSNNLLKTILNSDEIQDNAVQNHQETIALWQTSFDIFSSPYNHGKLSDSETIEKLKESPELLSEKIKQEKSREKNLAPDATISRYEDISPEKKEQILNLYKNFLILQEYENKDKGLLRLDSTEKNIVLSYLKENLLKNVVVTDKNLEEILKENHLKSLVSPEIQKSPYNHGPISRDYAEILLRQYGREKAQNDDTQSVGILRYSKNADQMVLSYLNFSAICCQHSVCASSATLDVLLETLRIREDSIIKLLMPKSLPANYI